MIPAGTALADHPTGTVTNRVLWRVLSKSTLCVVFLLFAYAHLMALLDGGFRLSLALLVAFETVMVVLVFLRRDRTEVDLSPLAVVAGLVGSFAALGFRPTGEGHELLVGQGVQVIGILIQLGASFSLGRSFGMVPANRGVKTNGLYRVVRHPFYLAYLITQGGYLINNPSLRNGAVLLIGAAFQVIRIHCEERLLGRDAEYRRYISSVRWHLIPGLW